MQDSSTGDLVLRSCNTYVMGTAMEFLYFSGTSYREHPWVNPVLSKRITISASSPISRYTDPKVLVSRTYQGTSYAGPRIEDGRNNVWWMIDIGQDHQLMCNYYTLSPDGSRAYIRCWKFQGSLDGKTSTDLRVHENDLTMCKPGQFASWPVVGPSALLPFRFFRVVLTDNPWNFCICFLELYGYFRQVDSVLNNLSIYFFLLSFLSVYFCSDLFRPTTSSSCTVSAVRNNGDVWGSKTVIWFDSFHG